MGDFEILFLSERVKIKNLMLHTNKQMYGLGNINFNENSGQVNYLQNCAFKVTFGLYGDTHSKYQHIYIKFPAEIANDGYDNAVH